jgi:hypothetical protein
MTFHRETESVVCILALSEGMCVFFSLSCVFISALGDWCVGCAAVAGGGRGGKGGRGRDGREGGRGEGRLFICVCTYV